MNGRITLPLLRHGDIAGLEPPRFRGRADPPLSGLGEDQARRRADYIASGWSVAWLAASPRTRYIATAAPLATAAGLSSCCWNTIDDIDYGGWTGLTHEEACEREPAAFDCWRQQPELMRFPDVESLQDLLARSADALRSILAERDSETVALATHDSAIRALLLQLTGPPLSFYHGLMISPCSVSEVVLENGTVRPVRVNETAHLR